MGEFVEMLFMDHLLPLGGGNSYGMLWGSRLQLNPIHPPGMALYHPPLLSSPDTSTQI